MLTLVLLALFLLFVKHLVVDFFLQGPYMYKNKGIYGHFGGISHAGLHGITTIFIFLLFVNPVIALISGLIDFVLHYHIDWAKIWINKKKNWGPTTHEEFWWLLGIDQFLHTVTYFGLILLILFG